MKKMDFSKLEARLFEQREQIEVVQKGLNRTIIESVVFILALVIFGHYLSKGWLIAIFAVYIALICLGRISFGLSSIAYKQIICRLMKQLDKKA